MDDGKISLPLVGRDDTNSVVIVPSGAVSYQSNSQIGAAVRSPPSLVENLKNGNVK